MGLLLVGVFVWLLTVVRGVGLVSLSDYDFGVLDPLLVMDLGLC